MHSAMQVCYLKHLYLFLPLCIYVYKEPIPGEARPAAVCTAPCEARSAPE